MKMTAFPKSIYKFIVNLIKMSTACFGEVEGLIFKFIGRASLQIARKKFKSTSVRGHALPSIKTHNAPVIKMVLHWHKFSQIENFETALLIFGSSFSL